jgi:hypothetical protein
VRRRTGSAIFRCGSTWRTLPTSIPPSSCSEEQGALQGVGIAIQAYLYRTAKDIEDLIRSVPAVRIVKGAYLEPADIAYPKKSDVDENFYTLCCRLMKDDAQKTGTLVHIATHDVTLADRLIAYIDQQKVPSSAYEFAMLYGIQRGQQQRLAQSGRRLRVLISYGEYWYPWYMRRLAERPRERHLRSEKPFRRLRRVRLQHKGHNDHEDHKGQLVRDLGGLRALGDARLAVGRFAAPRPRKKTMAITFDDSAEVERRGEHRGRAEDDRVDPARAEGAQGAAVAFVNEGKLYSGRRWSEARAALLRSWVEAGVPLGNHTYSHLDINDVRSRNTRTTWSAVSGRIRG